MRRTVSFYAGPLDGYTVTFYEEGYALLDGHDGFYELDVQVDEQHSRLGWSEPLRIPR